MVMQKRIWVGSYRWEFQSGCWSYQE